MTGTADVIRDAIVWDNHACMPLRAEDGFLPQLYRHKRSGHTVVSLNVGYDAMSYENGIRASRTSATGSVGTSTSSF